MKIHYFLGGGYLVDNPNKNCVNLLFPENSPTGAVLSFEMLCKIEEFYSFTVRSTSNTLVILKRFVMGTGFKKYCLKILNFLASVYRNFYFAKYYYVGLGYKMFMFLGKLYIWVGFTHYSLVPVPTSVKIFAKKKRIYLIGVELFPFLNLLATIRRVREMDIYKGKGLLEVRTYKGFTKMKSGKKKQY